MPTAAAIFGTAITRRMKQLGLGDVLRATREAAQERLQEVTEEHEVGCLATAAVNVQGPGAWGSLATWDEVTGQRPGIAAILAASGLVKDDRPCTYCGQDDRQPDMILCDRCDTCYHGDCAREAGGTRIHDGPWFCLQCKGHLTLHGAPDVT